MPYSFPGSTLSIYEKTSDGKVLEATVDSGVPPILPGLEYATGAKVTDLSTGITYANQGGTADDDAEFFPSGQSATATTDGTGTGQIAPNVEYVTVTSASADDIVTLPAPVAGKQICINVGATGFELRSTDPTTIAINGGTGVDAESAIAADSTCFLTCVSPTAWKGYFMDADGDLAKIEAAA